VRSGGGRAALDEAPDRSNESVHGERLLQERRGVAGRPAAENVVYLVCRDIQDGKIRPSLSQTTAELAAIHARHDDIGDHEVDGVRRRLDHFQRFGAVSRLKRAIALGPQCPTDQVPQTLLVVYYEDNLPRLLSGCVR
jgi:hypothetical protein